MKRALVVIAVFASFFLARTSFAVDPYVKVDEIEPGMSGYGLSVFKGADPERFNMDEVLGTTSWLGVQYVWARLSGAGLEHTGIVAGMSGSPTMVVDPDTGEEKDLGPVAYAYIFGKDPIAGITPIEYMHCEWDAAFNGQPCPMVADTPRIMKAHIGGRDVYAARLGEIDKIRGALQELGYISPEALDRVFDRNPQAFQTTIAQAMQKTRSLHAGIIQSFPESLPSGVQLQSLEAELGNALNYFSYTRQPITYDPTRKFRKGSSITDCLIDGDIQMCPTGTVAYVDDERLYAFGHPFVGEGFARSPAWMNEILGVYTSLKASFKMSNPRIRYEPIVIEYDGHFGIYGHRLEDPSDMDVQMTPVSFEYSFDGVSERPVHARIYDGSLTSFFVWILPYVYLGSSPELGGDVTLHFEGHATVRDVENPLEIKEFFTHRRSEWLPMGFNFILFSWFLDGAVMLLDRGESVVFEDITFRFVASSGVSEYRAEHAYFGEDPLSDKLYEATPGSTAFLTLELQEAGYFPASTGLDKTSITIPLMVPADAAYGSAKVLIMSARGTKYFDARPEKLDLPEAVPEVIAYLNAYAASQNKLYVQARFDPRDDKALERQTNEGGQKPSPRALNSWIPIDEIHYLDKRRLVDHHEVQYDEDTFLSVGGRREVNVSNLLLEMLIGGLPMIVELKVVPEKHVFRLEEASILDSTVPSGGRARVKLTIREMQPDGDGYLETDVVYGGYTVSIPVPQRAAAGPATLRIADGAHFRPEDFNPSRLGIDQIGKRERDDTDAEVKSELDNKLHFVLTAKVDPDKTGSGMHWVDMNEKSSVTTVELRAVVSSNARIYIEEGERELEIEIKKDVVVQEPPWKKRKWPWRWLKNKKN